MGRYKINKNLNFCVIVARKGSTRLPCKNKKKLLGKPLFQWTLESAIYADCFKQICMSTDDEDILQISSKYEGILLDRRPDSLCGANVKSTEVLMYIMEKYCKKEYGFKNFCLLQPTSPFRNVNHIQTSMDMLEKQDTKFVIGIKQYDTPPEFALSIDSGLKPIQEGYLTRITRTQDIKKTFHPAGGLYVGNIDSFLKNRHFYGPTSKGILLDHISAWDINDDNDFKIAEIFAKFVKNQNELIK